MEPTLFENILRIVRTFKGRLLIAGGLLLSANLLLITNPLLLRYAIENPHLTYPAIWAFLLLLIAAISAYFRYLMRVEFSKVSREVERTLRSKLFGQIQSQSREFYDHHGVGELIERLSSDMNAYRDVLGPGLLFPVYFLTMIIPGLAALFWISPLMASFSLIPIVLIPLINFVTRRTIYSISTEVQKNLAEMGNFVQEDFSGIRIIKSYGSLEDLYHRFSSLCHKLYYFQLRQMCYQGWLFPLLTTITRIVTVGLVVVAATFHLSPADFVSFMWIQSYIFFPVVILGWIIPMWQQGSASYQRLRDIYIEPNAVIGLDNASSIPPLADIEFKNLTFAYPGFKPTLKNLNLKIKGGTMVGITGSTGSGKSTLFKLLNREYEIPRSMITIGGKDIHDYPLSAFWQEMVSVDQIPFLFSKTIRENVGFGNILATEEQILQASHLADLHETVMEFEEGYNTLVGEKGVTLSGGQKSRVAIARAFLVNRSILLLDDIFASVDNQTALHLFEALLKNFEGKTILLSTTKVSILEKMDRLVILVKGEIAEEGTPKELLESKSRFAAMKELGS